MRHGEWQQIGDKGEDKRSCSQCFRMVHTPGYPGSAYRICYGHLSMSLSLLPGQTALRQQLTHVIEDVGASLQQIEERQIRYAEDGAFCQSCPPTIFWEERDENPGDQ